MSAVILLEDGSVFNGESIGKKGTITGEFVFNTCMTGYQEILTDPSYKGQIVVMTYPLIGNYGINPTDIESYQPHAEGMVVKELCKLPSNWRCTSDAEAYFFDNQVVGVQGVDTRSLTMLIRNKGSMLGIISTETEDLQVLQAKLDASKLTKRKLVEEVTTKKKYIFDGEFADLSANILAVAQIPQDGLGKRIAALDFGIKTNILRSMARRGFEIHVFPSNATYEELMAVEPDGVFLSNGPGDPTDLPEVIPVIQQCFGKLPVFGICLGHQLIGLALGGKTTKLAFGHHGGNQPVKDLRDNKCHITSQNHNYAVVPDSFVGMEDKIEITHVNLNDGTVEGLRHKEMQIFSVQYHPEACPGPRDSDYVFNDFLEMLGDKNAGK
ncbi:MAG: glutamine-hydrolyzing carbamoyl-phosphate synthase small subunit [Bacillota bacterium]